MFIGILLVLGIVGQAQPVYTNSGTPFGMPCYKYTIKGRKHTICWTVDDHPNRATKKVLQTFRRHNLKGTFFIVGAPLRYHAKSPSRVTKTYLSLFKRIQSDGHLLANHSVTHAQICKKSQRRVHWELSATQRLIQRYGGVTPKLFRPPHAIRCRKIRVAARRLKLKVVMYDISDYKVPARRMWRQLRWRVVRLKRPYTIVLIHSKYRRFERLLDYIKRNP